MGIAPQSNFTRTIGNTPIPLVFLSLSPSGSASKDRTLGYLDVTADAAGKPVLTLNTSWASRLATKPLDILGVTFGTCPSGDGVFVLYQGSDRKHLQFIAFQGQAFAADLQCPAGKHLCHLTGYIHLGVVSG